MAALASGPYRNGWRDWDAQSRRFCGVRNRHLSYGKCAGNHWQIDCPAQWFFSQIMPSKAPSFALSWVS